MSRNYVTSTSDGMVFASHARRNRNITAAAFEMIGGLEAFAEWAADNRETFYTRIWARTLRPEPEEAQAEHGVEALLDKLDGREQKTIEMSCETLDEEYEDGYE